MTFPETKVASIAHRGPPEAEHVTARKLIAWKLENRLLDPSRHRSYGLHYTDPSTGRPDDHRVDFCLSIEEDVGENPHGIVQRIIPNMRCAYARDVGHRMDNRAAAYLYEQWLPSSGEEPSGYPLIFHYVNVGPTVRDEDAITDVYVPIK